VIPKSSLTLVAPLTGIPIRLIAAGTTHCMALTGTHHHHHHCLTSRSCQTLTFTSCSVSGSLYCWGGYFFHLHDSAKQPTSYRPLESFSYNSLAMRSVSWAWATSQAGLGRRCSPPCTANISRTCHAAPSTPLRLQVRSCTCVRWCVCVRPNRRVS
jgi:hypothetical protein